MSTFTPVSALAKKKVDVDEKVWSQFKKELLGTPVVFVGAREKEAKFVAHNSKYLPINTAPAKFTSPSHGSKKSEPQVEEVLARDALKLQWETVFGHSKGFHNFGNTCFMNSALQCLVNTPPLVQLLVELEEHDCPAKGGRNLLLNGNSPKTPEAQSIAERASRRARFCPFCELKKLVLQSYDRASGRKTISPDVLASHLRLIGPTFRTGRQEDAHEFIRELLAKCDEEGGKHTRKFFDFFSRPVARLLPGEAPPPKPKPTSLYFAIFGSYVRSRVHCSKCGHNSDTFDPYMDLSIELRGHSLERSLLHFTSPETLDLDNLYSCGSCKRKIQPIKQLQIWQPPNVLMLHLKRFNIFGKKISKEIAYPETLDLSPYCTKDSPFYPLVAPPARNASNGTSRDSGANGMGHKAAHGSSANGFANFPHSASTASHTTSTPSSNDSPNLYHLYAVLLHHGMSSRSGHYTAVVKASNGIWVDANDSSLSKSSARRALQHQHDAYILFYARKNAIPSSASTDPSLGSLHTHINAKRRLDEMQEAFIKGDEDQRRKAKVTKRPVSSSSSESESESASASEDSSSESAGSDSRSSADDTSESSDEEMSITSSEDDSEDEKGSKNPRKMDIDAIRSKEAKTDGEKSKDKKSSLNASQSTPAASTTPSKDKLAPNSRAALLLRQKEVIHQLFGVKERVEPVIASKPGSVPKPVKKTPYDAKIWKANQLYGGNLVDSWSFGSSSLVASSASPTTQKALNKPNGATSTKHHLSKAASDTDQMAVDETSAEIIGTEGELERIALATKAKKMENRAISDLQLVAKQNKKRARSAYDIDYDRGKLKKVKRKEEETPSKSGSYRMHEEESKAKSLGINKFQAQTEAQANGGSLQRSKKETHIKGGADRVKRLQRERKHGKFGKKSKPFSGGGGGSGKPKKYFKKEFWKSKKK